MLPEPLAGELESKLLGEGEVGSVKQGEGTLASEDEIEPLPRALRHVAAGESAATAFTAHTSA